MESLGWRQRRGSSPAARRGARQRAGLTPVSASNILSCERETLTQSPIKKSLDSDHGIYRCEYSRRAAGAFTSEQNAVRYLPAHRIC